MRIRRFHFQKLTYCLFIALPFSGLMLFKFWKIIFATSSAFILICFATRLITEPIGFAIAFLIPIGLILIGWTKAFTSKKTFDDSPIQHFFALVTVNVIIFSLIFFHPTLLGIKFFYIPSQSMTPTLLPGDVVLVDTWHYALADPEVNDIAVFHHKNKRIYIKRITKIYEESFIVKGDNEYSSLPSKLFGNIKKNHLIGKANFILFNADFPKRSERYFHKLNQYHK